MSGKEQACGACLQQLLPCTHLKPNWTHTGASAKASPQPHGDAGPTESKADSGLWPTDQFGRSLGELHAAISPCLVDMTLDHKRDCTNKPLLHRTGKRKRAVNTIDKMFRKLRPAHSPSSVRSPSRKQRHSMGRQHLSLECTQALGRSTCWISLGLSPLWRSNNCSLRNILRSPPLEALIGKA